MKVKIQNIILMFALLILSGCVYVTSVEACVEGKPDGFWHGLLHGFISPFSFIVSIFNDKITVYEINNNGRWYNFGFILGASILLGSGGRAGKKTSRS